MAKQPYIPFYLGDYIKDTRILPLNVKGGWVDLILAMWDNDPRGELIGTIDDYARVMSCTINEANLVIQTLKQKKTFDYHELDNGVFKITSRKQKKMQKLSEIRKNVGKTGGNPLLLNQTNNKLVKQRDNLNTEYEYINENEIVFESKEGGVGEEIVGLSKSGFFLDSLEKSIELTEMQIGATIEFIRLKCKKTLTPPEIVEQWEAFKIVQFSIHEWYNGFEKLLNHFRNSIKLEIQKNINGTHKQANPGSGGKIGTSAARIEAARKF